MLACLSGEVNRKRGNFPGGLHGLFRWRLVTNQIQSRPLVVLIGLEPTPAAAKRILVVDDNRDMCALMRVALEGAGYEVRCALEGSEALAMLNGSAADLVITDIFMPGQEGFETISRCKAEFPQTRIIVMSAGTVPGMKHDFLATAGLLGVGATLRKPFSADQLLDAVQEVLR